MSLAVRIIPTLLMRGDQLVKGRQFQSWRSVGHIEQAMRIYQGRKVDEVVLLDIEATHEGRGPAFERVRKLTHGFFTPVTVGGGVRSIEDVRDLLRAGADKVAICTSAFERGGRELVQEIVNRFGGQALVLAMDVQLGRIVTRCGTHVMDTIPHDGIVRQAKAAEELGVGEILLTSIEREGTMRGYDHDLIMAVSRAVSIPVIAHGGCSNYHDMAQAITESGASAVAAGALFQFTDATPRGAAEYLAEHGIETRIPA